MVFNRRTVHYADLEMTQRDEKRMAGQRRVRDALTIINIGENRIHSLDALSRLTIWKATMEKIGEWW
jgi:hypothetical protein